MKKILSKGRLGPGEIIGVRIEKGKIFSNDQIKDYLAKEFKHFNSQIIDLDEKLPISNEQNNFEGENLRRRQYTFGISLRRFRTNFTSNGRRCKRGNWLHGR